MEQRHKRAVLFFFCAAVVGLLWATPVQAQMVANTTIKGVELEFTADIPSVDLTPAGSVGSLRPLEKVTLGLESISEVGLADGISYLSVEFVAGGWKVVTDTRYNATTSYLYSAALRIRGDPSDDNATTTSAVELQFFLFDKDTEVTVGDGLLPFTVTPALAKFSLRITDWPWLGKEDHGLEVKMNIAPQFNESQRLDATPHEGIATFKLIGQHPGNPEAITQIRLVDAVEIDGAVQPTGAVNYTIIDGRGQLVMRFSHFESYMLYDPDVGVLLGKGKGGDGSDGGVDDNTALIVSLAVILPIAAIVVIGAGVAVLVTYHVKRGRFHTSSSAVDIGPDHL